MWEVQQYRWICVDLSVDLSAAKLSQPRARAQNPVQDGQTLSYHT